MPLMIVAAALVASWVRRLASVCISASCTDSSASVSLNKLFMRKSHRRQRSDWQYASPCVLGLEPGQFRPLRNFLLGSESSLVPAQDAVLVQPTLQGPLHVRVGEGRIAAADVGQRHAQEP